MVGGAWGVCRTLVRVRLRAATSFGEPYTKAGSARTLTTTLSFATVMPANAPGTPGKIKRVRAAATVQQV